MRFDQLKRREFITLLGGAAAAWPIAGGAEQPGKQPIIGFLGAATPSATSPWATPFVQRLRELGWIEGCAVGCDVGEHDGWAVGSIDGCAEGWLDG